MAGFLYKLLFGFIYLVSLLPFWVLHGLSNFLFLIVYYGVGYRKKMVFSNLHKAFPEKSEKEIKKIAKDFYLHFCDLIIESVKSVSMNQKSFMKRYAVKNWDMLFDRLKKGESLLLVSPHSGNWEWVFSLVEFIPGTIYAIYQPLRNKHFDQYIRDTRQRYGVIMISMRETFRRILAAHEEKTQIVSWFAADQACNPQKAHWTTFLNQKTTFHAGYEDLAIQTNQAVLFLDIKKIGRSKYELELKVICDDPSKIQKGEIVDEFARLTEARIRETPAYWLWSHNRWKHAPESRVIREDSAL